MLKNNIIADLKLLKERPLLMLYLLAPVLIVLLLKLVFPLITFQLESLFRLAPENWLTLVLITTISSIPIITGMVLSYMHTYTKSLPGQSVPTKSEVIGSLVEPFLLTFFLVLICTLITNPVPAEGWLRTITVLIIISLHSPYVFVILKNRYLNGDSSILFYCFICYWIIAVPFGLVLTKPWHYFSFLSPFYWINWSWLTTSIIESVFLAAVFSFFIIFNIGFAVFAMLRKNEG